jgi:glycosyltransferase involved in cell wall biosynthesis
MVSILVVAHNEEDSVEPRLTNALAVDYPADRLEIVIASDGSTDRTVAIAGSVTDPRVSVVEFSAQRGKAAVLNDVLPRLKGDIVVLSDANTAMAASALRRIVRWFLDDRVGVVVGRLVLTDPATGRNVDGLYWRYETQLKRWDARLNALLGANGAIYGLRRRLFTPLPDETLVDDLVLPLLIRMNSGCEIVYDESVLANEETAADMAAEFVRRRRIGAGGFQSLALLWRLLSPMHGWIAFTFLSHKVLRWLCPFLLIGALTLNLLLAAQWPYGYTLALQALLYLAAAGGAIAPGSGRVVWMLRLSTLFASMNLALLAGFRVWLAGVSSGRWERTERMIRQSMPTATPTAADRSITIVHLVIGLGIGGLEMVVANLTRQMGRRFRLHVICLEGLGPIASRFDSPRVTVECIGRPDTPVLRSVMTLRRRLRALKPDVVHTHNEKAHIRGALATLGMRRAPALVHTRHGETRAAGVAAFANRLAVWRSGFIVSVSQQASAISRAEGASIGRLRVIRNGIDLNRSGRAAHEARPRCHAVAVGRLTTVKDLETMLRAASIVSNALPSFHLDVVGDGPSRQALEVLQRQLGLERHVTFRGATDDVAGTLGDADLFVQSSLSEGISLTLLEAMAAGVPIAATDVGGTPEVVEHGVTGLLVKPQDPGALAEAMLTILQDRDVAERMGNAGRNRVERHFSVQQMAASYEALYEEAVARTRVAAA